MTQIAPPETLEDIDKFIEDYVRTEVYLYGTKPSQEKLEQVRQVAEEHVADNSNTTKSYRVTLKASDCGSHGGPGGGFTSGNSCAEGRGGSGTAEKETPKTGKQQALENHHKRRQEDKDDYIELEKMRLDGMDIEKDTSAFNQYDGSKENLERYEELGRKAESDGPLSTDESKARYLRAHDVVSDRIDELGPEYVELLADGFVPGDAEHQKTRRVQANKLANDMGELVDGANRNLLEKGIMIDAEEAKSSFKPIAGTIVSDMDTGISNLEMKVAETLNAQTSIADATQMVEEAFRKTGSDKPDFSDLKFKLTNENAVDHNGLTTKSGREVSGGVFGNYNSATGVITIDTDEATLAVPKTWTAGSSGEGTVGMVVHEIGHQLHHRKLMNKYNPYKSANSDDLSAAGKRHKYQNFHKLTDLHLGTNVKRNMGLGDPTEIDSPFQRKYGKAQAKVGKYGLTNYQEFVAEAFAMKVLKPDRWNSKEMADVRELYDICEGP